MHSEEPASRARHGSGKLNWFLPDAFGFIRELKSTPPASKKPLIDLSIGAPNRPTPPHVIKAMKRALDVPAYHTYPPPFGMPELRDAVAEWYECRFRVKVDPAREVLVTVGIKEAIFNSLHALLNAGDVVLVPDPGYPTYFEAVTFCGAKMASYDSDQDEEHTLQAIEAAAKVHRPSYAFVNYPANPTGRVVTPSFYRKLDACARENGFTVLGDLAYSEIAFDGQRACSCFPHGNVDGGLEYFAFSKTYNMAGFRVGAIVADQRLLEPIKLYKSKIDSNVFSPIQLAAAHALRATQESYYRELVETYQQRRDSLVAGLVEAGLSAVSPQGAMYVWVRVPQGSNPWSFTRRLYDVCGVLGVPGVGYGANGKGHVRLGLVQEKEIMQQVADRLRTGDIHGVR